MAKLSGPLLSFDARASLGKAVVYSSWKGISYARRWVQPANPNTVAQQATRLTMKWLMSVWSFMPAEVQESWDAYAAGQPMTGRNALAKLNIAALIGQADLTNFVFAPSAKSGPVAAALGATPGNDLIDVTLTAPVMPQGWSIVQAVWAIIRQQDPQTGTLYAVTALTDASSAYSAQFTGLASAQTYVVGGWFKYLKPDGSFAYGRALQTTALTT